jgi:hypothetical protein
MLAFRVAGGELLGVNACGVSPVPLLPQESRTSAPINLKSFRFKNHNLYEKSLKHMKFT